MTCSVTHLRTNLPHVVQQWNFLLPQGRFGVEGVVDNLVRLHIEVAKLFLLSITRLNKFETFQKIVVEELANLEKETQILAAMEKDALVRTAPCVPARKGAPSQVTGVFFGGLFRISGMHSCSN